MLGILLLLIFGKLQESLYTETSQAWHWALAYAAISGVSAGVFGGAGMSGLMVALVLLFLYSWGYFALLRRFSDNLLLWLLVYFLGALLPFVVTLGFIP